MKAKTLSLMMAVLVSAASAYPKGERMESHLEGDARDSESLEEQYTLLDFGCKLEDCVHLLPELLLEYLAWPEAPEVADEKDDGFRYIRREAHKVVSTVAKDAKAVVKDVKTTATFVSDGVNLATDILTGDVVKGIVDAIKITVEGIIHAFELIHDQEKKDAITRGKFAEDTIAKLRSEHPQMNFVMIHTKHHYNFPGTKGTDWYHDHKEVPVGFPIHSTIGFEIYGFRTGEFHRDGDGGSQNWYWGGNPTKNDGDGKDMVFAAPN